MGNCLVSNKVMAQEDDVTMPSEEARRSASQSDKSDPAAAVMCCDADKNVKKVKRNNTKRVSFRLKEEDGDEADTGGDRNYQTHGGRVKNGVVRLRMVVTKEELRQIVKYTKENKCSSMEQLLSALKMRNRSLREVGFNGDVEGFRGSWRPCLESIDEEL